MNSKYNDILHLPHKKSETRPHMPVSDRAAQFAPFAALTGYDSAIRETARLTDRKRELGESELEELNGKLIYIGEHLDEPSPVKITYFRADKKKSGGAYIVFTGTAKRIDQYEKMMIMTDGTKIPIEDIYDVSLETEQENVEYN